MAESATVTEFPPYPQIDELLSRLAANGQEDHGGLAMLLEACWWLAMVNNGGMSDTDEFCDAVDELEPAITAFKRKRRTINTGKIHSRLRDAVVRFRLFHIFNLMDVFQHCDNRKVNLEMQEVIQGVWEALSRPADVIQFPAPKEKD